MKPFEKNILMNPTFFFYRVFLFVLLGLPILLPAQQIYTVTTGTDSEPSQDGQLRKAIEEVNKGNYNYIEFNIPSPNDAPVTIQLTSALPRIEKEVGINGLTQKGYKYGEPSVIIDGSKGLSDTSAWIDNGIYYYYLTFNTGQGVMNGIQLQNFKTGLYFSYCRYNDGNAASTSENKIINCTQACVTLLYTRGFHFANNFINSNKDRAVFDTPAPKYGFLLLYNGNADWSTSNTVGGVCGEVEYYGNIIGYTKEAAVLVNGSRAFGNQIGNIIYGKQTAGIKLINRANNEIKPPVITNVTDCSVSGTATPDALISLYGRVDSNYPTADTYIANYAQADKDGNWQTDLYFIEQPFIVATQTDLSNNTSEFSEAKPITPTVFDYTGPNPLKICVNKSITLSGTFSGCSNAFSINYGDGSPATTSTTHTYIAVGTYTINIDAIGGDLCRNKKLKPITVIVDPCIDIPPPPCVNCLGSFSPEPGKKYIIGAWVKEQDATPTKVSYDFPQLFIEYPGTAGGAGPFTARGAIIDGWQRIEEEFEVPAGAKYISLKLTCTTGNCFYDDVRVFPTDGSMKTYVFDPITLRLMAELDERNYATLYEYDEEGKPVRLKKETERGIMTISENRNNTVKK